MTVILVSFRYGSNSLDRRPYLVFLPAGLPRDQYLEARGNHERPGYLITGEAEVSLPSGSVDLDVAYEV